MPKRVSVSRAATFFHRRTRVEWALLLAAVVLVTALVARLDWFERTDLALLDFSISSQPHAPRNDIVLVTIDDASIGALGRWPWRRSVLASLVDRIAADRPRVIGLDVMLSEPDIRYPADDVDLAQAIVRAGNVVLPVLAEAGPVGPAMRQSLETFPATRGHINMSLDTDGVARSVYLREGQGDDDVPPVWHFAAAMAAQGQASPPSPESFRHEAARHVDSSGWVGQDRLRIPFAGPPGTFSRVSALDVLSGQPGPGFFRGKYVIVGAMASSTGDTFATPVSHNGRGMSGVEVLANALQTLRDGTAIVRVPELAGWFATLLPVMLAALAAWVLTPRDALIAVAVLVAALIGGSIMLVGSMQLWFAPSAAVFGCLLVYPLWSWRRQEAALRFLSEELARLVREPGLLGAPARVDHSLDGRMQAVYDMTSRLRDMRRFLSDGLESLPEATVISNLDGGILVANRRAVALVPAVLHGINDLPQPAGLGGLPNGHLDAGAYDDAYGGLDRPGLPDIIETLFPVPGPGLAYWDALCDALDADAPVMSSSDSHGVELATEDDRRYLLHGAPLHGETGRPAGVIVSLIDITTVRRAERQREQTLHFLSHDMRSPQASILALIDLQSRPERALPQNELLHRIGDHAHRTLALADDFIRLAQAESQSLAFAEVDLTTLVLDATDELWALAKARGIDLQLDLDGDGVTLRAAPALLVRAIANLVSNAIKFSPDGAPVTVGLRRLGPYMAIEVADQGPGIAAEAQARLFRPFSRVHAAGSDAPAGSGLGLVFVKTVAERHGGRVMLRSAAGEGATFSIWLPLRSRAG
ncbi:CHASE2 and HATPase_c domain-containing protein [Cupriavidus pauculus]|uniref:CHASE2 and HATPase_c domain-containing protein n=1 Tax=Cupriavidus pauculus TaxID=82633 RepID=UPI001EE18F10|nr:CHASE2 and HATPase_c domain-containing protein [Cupriavidus pauculus]GJG95221.1 CHASE2 domain-containing protein [Cupriavidus pauculus]